MNPGNRIHTALHLPVQEMSRILLLLSPHPQVLSLHVRQCLLQEQNMTGGIFRRSIPYTNHSLLSRIHISHSTSKITQKIQQDCICSDLCTYFLSIQGKLYFHPISPPHYIHLKLSASLCEAESPQGAVCTPHFRAYCFHK